MAIIPKPPEDLCNCKLYKHLLEKSTPKDGCAERVHVFVNTVTPLLDLIIAGPFKDYTLHNHNHAKKLLHLAEYIIPPDTLDSLSPLECQAFIYSAFLHDLGMSLSSEERERILATPDYTGEFKEWTALWDALLQARKRLDDLPITHPDEKAREAERLMIETEIFQLQEAALAAYLRPRHATPERYAQLIAVIKRNSSRSDLFESKGVSFEKWLIDINISHNQDVGALAEIYGPNQERFPRDLSIGGQKLNTQFIAAVLRITDILDFDNERTPRILFESLGIASRSLPGSDVSLQEWQKHMAIHDIDISTDELVISAECQHPAIEKTVRDF
jgi:molecular chaperone HtpG